MATSTIPANYKSESISTSYGTVYVITEGHMVNVRCNLQNLPTSAWATVATDLPKPRHMGVQTVAPDSSSNGFVSVYISAQGVFQVYGRGSYASAVVNVVYSL